MNFSVSLSLSDTFQTTPPFLLFLPAIHLPLLSPLIILSHLLPEPVSVNGGEVSALHSDVSVPLMQFFFMPFLSFYVQKLFKPSDHVFHVMYKTPFRQRNTKCVV